MKLGHNQILKSILQLVLGLIIFTPILFLFMRWQAKGYEKSGGIFAGESIATKAGNNFLLPVSERLIGQSDTDCR